MARVRVLSRRPRWLARRPWRAERRTFRRGLIALGLSTLAGFAAGSFEPTFRRGSILRRNIDVSIVTTGLAIGSHVRGWELDAVATPLVTALGDVTAMSRVGLDPDDQTVPVLTSVMDVAGVACVLAIVTWIGVLAHG